MRFPAVFTALADIFLGFLLTHENLAPVGNLVALLGASSGLYLAGMIFNDWFDRDLDARERPGRPIPSGRITPRVAVGLASALMILGAACAVGVSRQAVEISLMLVGLILAYDGFLKQTPVGPIAMGGCRFLNVMLGASAGIGPTWASPQLVVALAMGVYVAGVTWFARQEAQQSSRTQLAAAATIVHVGLVGLAAIMLSLPSSAAIARWLALASLALVAIWIDVRLFAAIRDPTPRNVQSSVKRMLLAIVLLDATLVYWATGNPVLALGVAALLIPAATLGRWIFIT
ncbi:MAG TPA: UbiA family prenyltransferase [Planctomycetaceae bacterium]|jgi:4-hydroxybenzoate polyprenyltransferase|nr:UbiA family prenyltransferase [Planctomycetaceae bacterium]